MKAARIIEQEIKTQPEGTDEIVNINYIYIPKDFRKTRPREYKVKKAIRYYQTHGYFDKPISIYPEINTKKQPNRLIIVDEYTRLLAAINLKVKEIPVKYI